jgi:hypothetical protein
MEELLRHVKKYTLYYILGTLCFIVVASISYNLLNRRVENFQEKPETASPTVAAGAPVKLSKDMCINLKSQINQYRQVKDQHKDIEVLNLDETLKLLETYFKDFGCELHTY